MKRAPFVIGATGVGLGLLFSFHTRPIHITPVSTGGNAAGTTPGTSGVTPTTGETTPTTAGTSPSSPGTTPTTSTPATSAAPTTVAPSTTTGVRTATGQDIPYRYGDIQLRVTERESTITKIQVVEEGATDPRSAQINSQAVPMLQQQAMSVQSANIDGVSGATFTSAAYQEALQSALDQLR